MSIGDNSGSEIRRTTMGKRSGKRPGRKPSKIDERAKLERSRQSARECRARKKLRYQYLEELVLHREKAVFALRDELETYKQWCMQLDSGGRIPESLLKAIVNEEMSKKKQQMEAANKSLLQQQQQQLKSQEMQFSASSSTSSSSSESSSPLRTELSSHKLPPNLLNSQSDLQPSTSSCTFENYHEGWSPPLQQLHHPDQHHVPQTKQSPTKSSLERQLEIDQSLNLQMLHKLPSEPQASSKQPQVERGPSSCNPTSIAVGLFKQQKQQQSLQQHQRLYDIKEKEAQHSLQHFHNTPTSSQFYQKPLIDVQSGARNDPYKRFQSVGKHSPVHKTQRSLFDFNETIRARSFSNPASMISIPQTKIPVTSSQIISSLSHTSKTSQISQGQLSSLPNQGIGLFTGSPVDSKSRPLTLDLPAAAVVEESSSSNDNVNVQQLFRYASLVQKRALSDLVFAENPKRTSTATNLASPATAAMNFDPHAKLQNLTTVRCLSSNTPSPSSFLDASPGTPSPKTSTFSRFKPSSTPTSSTSTSPAPPFSVSSHLDFSPVISFSGFNSPVESTDFVMSSAQCSGPSNPATVSGSYTNLVPSIDVPIHEVLSLLDNIRESDMSPSPSTHGTPLALTPRPHQSATPDPSFSTVPKIIHDFLQSSDQSD